MKTGDGSGHTVLKIDGNLFYKILLKNVSFSEFSLYHIMQNDDKIDFLSRLYFVFAVIAKGRMYVLNALRDELQEKK